MKQWQNFQAFSKVKAGIEQQVRDAAAMLENSLDKGDVVALAAEECSQYAMSLGRIAGVLRMMECQELALLAEEILGLLEDTARIDAGKERHVTEARELAFVALTDFPALVEGVLSGHIQHWHGISQLFNRIRQARGKGLVFSSRTLLTKEAVVFKKLFTDNPEHFKALLDEQLKLYNNVKKQLQSSASVMESLQELHLLFVNLEVMSRDFRLATLWGLCAAIAEAMPEDQAKAEHPAMRLLCSFSTIIQMVRDKGIKALGQNVPEDILSKVLAVLAQLPAKTERLTAIKCWFNLDPELADAYQKRYQELLISYSRKDAFTRVIRLLTDRTSQLSDQINEAIAEGRNTPQQIAKFTDELRAMQNPLAMMNMGSLVELLVACANLSPANEGTEQSLDEATGADYLDNCAQTLYRCELSLQRQAEELERAVFVSRAGKQDSTALTGAKLSVVLEAIKNLDQVVIAINNYADASWDSSKLLDSARLLRSAGFALATVPLPRAADFCAVAAKFVETRLTNAALIPQDPSFDSAVQAFAHVVISAILYLEQLSIGRTENCRRIEQECNKDLQILRFGDVPAVFADADDMPGSEPLAVSADTSEALSASVSDVHVAEPVESTMEIALADTTAEDPGAVASGVAVTAVNDGVEPAPNLAAAEPAAVDEDEEIHAIFIEEASELLAQISECHTALSENTDDAEALTTLRRSYHTLKGSGRMVGAAAIGALAWRVENLLNNVISGRLQSVAPMLDMLLQVRERLISLVAEFEAKLPTSLDADAVTVDIALVDAFLPEEKPAVVEQPAPAAAVAAQQENPEPAAEAATDIAREIEQTFPRVESYDGRATATTTAEVQEEVPAVEILGVMAELVEVKDAAQDARQQAIHASTEEGPAETPIAELTSKDIRNESVADAQDEPWLAPQQTAPQELPVAEIPAAEIEQEPIPGTSHNVEELDQLLADQLNSAVIELVTCESVYDAEDQIPATSVRFDSRLAETAEMLFETSEQPEVVAFTPEPEAVDKPIQDISSELEQYDVVEPADQAEPAIERPHVESSIAALSTNAVEDVAAEETETTIFIPELRDAPALDVESVVLDLVHVAPFIADDTANSRDQTPESTVEVAAAEAPVVDAEFDDVTAAEVADNAVVDAAAAGEFAEHSTDATPAMSRLSTVFDVCAIGRGIDGLLAFAASVQAQEALPLTIESNEVVASNAENILVPSQPYIVEIPADDDFGDAAVVVSAVSDARECHDAEAHQSQPPLLLTHNPIAMALAQDVMLDAAAVVAEPTAQVEESAGQVFEEQLESRLAEGANGSGPVNSEYENIAALAIESLDTGDWQRVEQELVVHQTVALETGLPEEVADERIAPQIFAETVGEAAVVDVAEASETLTAIEPPAQETVVREMGFDAPEVIQQVDQEVVIAAEEQVEAASLDKPAEAAYALEPHAESAQGMPAQMVAHDDSPAEIVIESIQEAALAIEEEQIQPSSDVLVNNPPIENVTAEADLENPVESSTQDNPVADEIEDDSFAPAIIEPYESAQAVEVAMPSAPVEYVPDVIGDQDSILLRALQEEVPPQAGDVLAIEQEAPSEARSQIGESSEPAAIQVEPFETPGGQEPAPQSSDATEEYVQIHLPELAGQPEAAISEEHAIGDEFAEDLVAAAASESVVEPTSTEPASAITPADSLTEILEVEFRRRIGVIRQYLDGSVRTDADGLPISSTSYLIPVHTLYGNCKVAEFQQFGVVVGRLEKLLQDHPHRQVTPLLQALLAGFCDLTEKVIQNPGEDMKFTPSAELQHKLDSFVVALDHVRMEMAGPAAVETSHENENTFSDGESGDDKVASSDNVDEAVMVVDEAALVREGFRNEARTINALVQNLYAAFVHNDGCDPNLAGRLRDQFALLEGAAIAAGQQAIVPLCRELVSVYQQYAEGLYASIPGLAELLGRCHSHIDACMSELDTGATVVTGNEDLHAGLKQAVQQLISSRNAAQIQITEEQVEDSLLAVFIEEASEILQELDSKVADWQQAPDDRNIFDELLRSLHTLKGSAALVGEKEMSEAAHVFESCVIDSDKTRANRNPKFFAEIDRHLNILQVLFSLYHTDETGRVVKTTPNETELGQLASRDEAPAAVSAVAAVSGEEAQNDEVVQLQAVESSHIDASASNNAGSKTNALAKGANNTEQNAAIDEHVRVSANLLKSLLNDADEISIARNRVEQTVADVQILMADMEETLGRIESSMNTFEFYAKTRAGIRQGENGNGKPDSDTNDGSKDFDALEMDKYTELQQVVLSLLEDYNDVRDLKNNVAGKIKSIGTILDDQQRSTNKLQEGLVSSQMVPFAGIAPRLRRLVRQVSTELGKQITINFDNPEGKVDRSVLQALINPIEHMIRNAIDHGVESAQERAAAGKPARGELQVKLYRQGANMILDITDDGRGINTAKVRQKAIAQGLLAEGEQVTEQELRQFILRAGFSTSDTVSRISGRGVGLDVVQEEISQIGGDIEILSSPGQGTTFRIRLPMASSLNRALLFSVSGAEYVMLLNTIDGIILEKNDTLQRCHGEDIPTFFNYGDKSYELAYLGSLLDEQTVPEFQGGNSGSSSLVLVSGNGKNLALHVDSVVGSRELVVKSLGAQFSSISVLTGGVILGDGRVVVVLDPRFLVENHTTKKIMPAVTERARRNAKPQAEFETGKTVMVVDDSITVRKVTSAILKRNGMNVILAKNGMEAVELLQTTKPDVMLLDIEMPKMDGFEVAAYVRRQEDGIRNLPIIMITSRIGDKHRSRAEEIGVNQYMCKPFQEVNLLEAIAGYN